MGSAFIGLGTTASFITVAAAIMVVVFGAFAFSRVLVGQLIGFAPAAAVLLDAAVIRMVLVPAFMHIAGRWNWWPGVRAGSRPEVGVGSRREAPIVGSARTSPTTIG